MRKRALSILLCVALALSLAACGGGQTSGNNTEPPAESTSSDQQTTEPESTQPEETEPAETKPTETESEETQPTETESEETQPTETAPEASAFLALLQAEYQSDTALGLTEQHAYYDQLIWLSTAPKASYRLFVFGDTLYFFCANDGTWFAYNTATKTQTPLTGPDISRDAEFRFFLDGAVYYFKSGDFSALIRDDMHGNTTTFKPAEYSYLPDVVMIYYGGGFLCCENLSNDACLYTGNLQKIAAIPAPQQEAAHGLTETVQLARETLHTAGGKIYATGFSNNSHHFYSLDPTAAAPEWTDLGELSAQPEVVKDFVWNENEFWNFLGRYYYSPGDHCFYDVTTGETVLKLGEVYEPAERCGKIYFGGDSYIGYKDKEYRMVNLANGTMSDPLTLPEKYNGLYFLTDTYCAYSDDYGIFLWNYLTGEETTIVMFEQN